MSLNPEYPPFDGYPYHVIEFAPGIHQVLPMPTNLSATELYKLSSKQVLANRGNSETP